MSNGDYVPYLTAEDFATFTVGEDFADISPEELDSILKVSSILVDAYCRTTFQYQELTEQHDWNDSMQSGTSVDIWPYCGPIRSIESLQIAVSIDSSGNLIGPSVPTSPVVSTSPGDPPPRVFGTVVVDNKRGYLQCLYYLLRFGLFAAYPQLGLTPPQVVLKYTCGYDPADAEFNLDHVPSDEYSLPIPAWLREATRLTAVMLVAERDLGILSMTALSNARVGDMHIARATGRATANQPAWQIPNAAKDMLNPHRRVEVA